jgi:dTDP-4-dehydrorhamnose reductase
MSADANQVRLFVVGVSSFIGRHLGAPGTTSTQFNLLTDRLGDIGGATHVVIAAAITNMDRCLTDRDTAWQVNVTRTLQLIEDIRRWGARPVFLSTNFVFDGRQGFYADDAPCSPVNEYGRQKAAVEQYMRARVPEGLVARLCCNVGDDPAEHHLFSQWHRLLRAGEPIVCIAGSRISPTYVGDTARALVLACQRGLTGVYNVANPESFYREELARLFCAEAGRPDHPVQTRPLSTFGFKDGRPLLADLDSRRFVRETGFVFTPMREVIRRFLRHAS